MASGLNPSQNDQSGQGLSFGPFTLRVAERLLLRDGAPVELGSRALDILAVLTAAPNECVSKRDLMARVWPDVIVEEGNLRFQMISLRKALGDGQDGARYITTLPGRGYCFVAPISRSGTDASGGAPIPPRSDFPHANLPSPLGRMVGRTEDVAQLASQIADARLVTILGAGGIGKTTVAIAAGNAVSASFAGAVLFVDFGVLSDPKLVIPAFGSMLGLPDAGDNLANVVAYLRDRRVLLILDTCEHLIDAVTELLEGILGGAPQINILTTSREAFRIEGERVYRLETLTSPPDDPEMPVEAMQNFPAIQLFFERAAASGARLVMGAADVRMAASICRKLDGLALAVELAAKRVETCGLHQTEMLLDQHLALKWVGSRTAPPRQKTLEAAIDWSYQLLSDVERRVLRRLSVFVWAFTLDAALDVAVTPSLDRATIVTAIDSLVAKSMVAAQPMGTTMRYRVLDATRAYVLHIETPAEEVRDLSIRHAAYHQRWLENITADWESHSAGLPRQLVLAMLHNVRAALDWCFDVDGDAAAGVRLAAAAAPVFLSLSLLPECKLWSERALQALDGDVRDDPSQASLEAALKQATPH